MRYAVPVNEAGEVGALAAAGAGELYCGYQDAWWTSRYGNHDSATRRQGAANLATLNELEHCTREARAHGLPLWLALNARYTEPQLDHLVWLCREFEEMGGTGVITSDLGLLWRLHAGTSLRCCLSLLAVAQNVPTLLAYQQLGVSRVVLPRFVGPDRAKTLLEGVPGIEAEAMAFFDKCPWVDGYCRHRHGITYLSREVPDGVDEAPPLFTFDTTYQTHACLGRACTYLEPYPCAACHLAQFEQAGVGIAKLGGRGRPLDERLRAVHFLKASEECSSDEERMRLYRQTFGGPCACYYGDAIQRHSAMQPVEPPAWANVSMLMGSQTDTPAYRRSLVHLLTGEPAETGTLGLLVPPLSDEGIAELVQALPQLSARYGPRLTLYANDLGTLLTLNACDAGCCIAAGTLLARTDDPAEVAHALSPDLNPPRTVWGPSGEPRVLTYRRPPEELIEHWRAPSLFEPSAQEALRALCESAVPPR